MADRKITIITPKRSYVKGKVPSLDQVIRGELTVNLKDKKFYIRDDNDVIQDMTVNPEMHYAAIELTQDSTGFINRFGTELIFQTGMQPKVIIKPKDGTTWSYYYKGREMVVEGGLSYTISVNEYDKGQYISLNGSKTLVNTGPYGDFVNTALCFYIHYSSETNEFIIQGDERHSASRDTTWHYTNHRDIGMVIRKLGRINWTANDAFENGFQITNTIVADEDLEHNIIHSENPTLPFTQTLEGITDYIRIPTLFSSTENNICSLESKKIPWMDGPLKYNDLNDGGLTDLPTNKFMNYFLVATHCQKYPIKLIMGREIFNTTEETVRETLEALGLNFPEIAMLYRIILKRDNSLSNTGKCVITSVQQATSKSIFENSANLGGSELGDHEALLNRGALYQHPIRAITGLVDELAEMVEATETAQAKADKAEADALRAQEAADIADEKAVRAQLSADLGIAMADEAQETADFALESAIEADYKAVKGINKADTAQAKADKAEVDAANAFTRGDLGVNRAEAAQSRAEDAMARGDLAVNKADAAQAKANKAEADAASAYSRGSAAYLRAGDALSRADQAYAAATTGAGDASLVMNRANEAYNKANDAQARADSAYSKAETALQVALTGGGSGGSGGGKDEVARMKADAAQAKADSAFSKAETALALASAGGGSGGSGGGIDEVARMKADAAYSKAEAALAAATSGGSSGGGGSGGGGIDEVARSRATSIEKNLAITINYINNNIVDRLERGLEVVHSGSVEMSPENTTSVPGYVATGFSNGRIYGVKLITVRPNFGRVTLG